MLITTDGGGREGEEEERRAGGGGARNRQPPFLDQRLKAAAAFRCDGRPAPSSLVSLPCHFLPHPPPPPPHSPTPTPSVRANLHLPRLGRHSPSPRASFLLRSSTSKSPPLPRLCQAPSQAIALRSQLTFPHSEQRRGKEFPIRATGCVRR